MERKFPDLAPVKHKKEGYQGWIDGVTKIESLFTGKVKGPWQYRVYLPDGTRKVAPEEDLVAQSDSPGFPPKELLSRYVDSFEGESDLHALGYNLTDLNPEERQKMLLLCALPIIGPERILKSLCDILWRKVRRNKEEKIDKYHNALAQWSHDLDFILRHESVDLKKLDWEILNYLVAVKDHLERYAHIPSDVSLASLKELLEKKAPKDKHQEPK